MSKNYVTISALALILTLCASNAFAEEQAVQFPKWPETSAPSDKQPNNTPSINDSANAGAAAQAAAAQYNQLVALLCFDECFKSNNNAYCVMGMLALQQAAHTGGAATQSKNTAKASSRDENSGPKGEYTVDKGDSRIQQAKDVLKKAGISVDKDGNVKTPDGKTLPASTFASPQSIAQAGFQPVSFDKIQPNPGEIGSKASIAAVGTSGGGSGIAEGSGGGEYRSPASEPFSFGRISAEDRKRMVAGKTVMFDGEPIGVSRDNIFEKIHSAYEKKKSDNHFILSNRGK